MIGRHIKVHKNTNCKMCRAEYEHLIHFMINCKELEEERNNQLIMKKKETNDENTVGNLLFDIEKMDLETAKKMLQTMSNKRNRIVKKLEKVSKSRDKPKE